MFSLCCSQSSCVNEIFHEVGLLRDLESRSSGPSEQEAEPGENERAILGTIHEICAASINM